MKEKLDNDFLKRQAYSFVTSKGNQLLNKDKDVSLQRYYLNFNEEFYRDFNAVYLISDIYERLSPYGKPYVIIRNDHRLKVRNIKKVVKSIPEKQAKGTLCKNYTIPKQDIIKEESELCFVNFNDMYEDKDLECDCLLYKCGDQKSRVLPLHSVSVIFEGSPIVHNFNLYTLFPEKKTNQLYKGYSYTYNVTSLEFKASTLQNIYNNCLKNWSTQKIINLINDMKSIKKFTKEIEQYLQLGDSLKVKELESNSEILIKTIENKYNIHRTDITQIVGTWYYISNRKDKLLTSKMCRDGIYLVPPELLPYVSEFTKKGDKSSLDFYNFSLNDLNKQGINVTNFVYESKRL